MPDHTSTDVTRLVTAVREPDALAMTEARDRQRQLTKPAGSLGVLEPTSVRLAGVHRQCPPVRLGAPVVAVFAGDHGVHAQQVTPWPQEVTASMVANIRAGGAGVNVLARQAGAAVVVVDVGVAADLPPGDDLLARKVAPGTRDLATGPAMSRQQAEQALLAGASVAEELVGRGHDVLLTGDMGIANTTPSAALVAAMTGTPPDEVTGRGTGVDDVVLARKTAIVADAVGRLSEQEREDPIAVLAAVGGFEHAALAGFLLAGAGLGVPVLLDGVVSGAAALVAAALAPGAVGHWFAGHRSAEPGHAVALADLGLRPLVDLDLRLGEGTGALLALPLLEAAGATLREMATFDAAGVTRKDQADPADG